MLLDIFELRNRRTFCHCEAIGRGNLLTMQSEMRLLRGVYPALVAGLAMTKVSFVIQSRYHYSRQHGVLYYYYIKECYF